MVNYSAIDTGSKLGGFMHEPMTFFIIIAVIIVGAGIAYVVYSLMGGN